MPTPQILKFMSEAGTCSSTVQALQGDPALSEHAIHALTMHLLQAGELFDYIVEKGRLLEEDARQFFQQIISGVEYCHRNMVGSHAVAWSQGHVGAKE